MRIEQPDLTDEKVIRACYDVMLAAHKADEPVEPPMAYATFCLYLREGWEQTPGEVWVALDDAGAVTGYYRMHLPDLENLDEASGRSGSIRIGSAALEDTATKVLVQSVDQPCSADVLRALYTSPAAIAIPTYECRRGHPVCFAAHLLAQLRAVTEEQQGLRAVVRAHREDVAQVAVDDPAVTWNLNDPAAYAAAVAAMDAR